MVQEDTTRPGFGPGVSCLEFSGLRPRVSNLSGDNTQDGGNFEVIVTSSSLPYDRTVVQGSFPSDVHTYVDVSGDTGTGVQGH